MQDQIQHVKGLIALLDVDASKKQELNEQLAKSGVTDGLMAEIKTCLDQMGSKLDSMVPETADIQRAQAEFEAEMAAIEKEAAQLEKQTNADLDKIDLETAKTQLK